jgi:prepilin-type N-terminal cleavage/methylation domain-containing protein
MRLRNTKPTTVRGVPFTLIELLTVMLIVGILLAVTVPVLVKITSGSSVEAASRMVGSQLRLARQEAISKRKTVAVLFPTANSATGDATSYVAFRPCIVTRATSGTADYVWQEWVTNAAWSFAPIGAVVAEVDGDGAPATGVPSPPVDDPPIITIGSVPGYALDVRAIVFKASGQVGGSLQRYVTLVEGALPTGAATPLIKNGKNWIDINVNQYTGRVTYKRPGE